VPASPPDARVHDVTGSRSSVAALALARPPVPAARAEQRGTRRDDIAATQPAEITHMAAMSTRLQP